MSAISSFKAREKSPNENEVYQMDPLKSQRLRKRHRSSEFSTSSPNKRSNSVERPYEVRGVPKVKSIRN